MGVYSTFRLILFVCVGAAAYPEIVGMPTYIQLRAPTAICLAIVHQGRAFNFLTVRDRVSS